MWGGGDGTKAHLPNAPPPLVAVPGGWRGLGRGCPTCRAGGGGGSTPTYMAQNDAHVALIILTTHMWGKMFRENNFPGQNLCSGAFGGNIRLHTKQRARQKAHFWKPPPSFAWRPSHPPPPPPRKAIFRSPSLRQKPFATSILGVKIITIVLEIFQPPINCVVPQLVLPMITPLMSLYSPSNAMLPCPTS